MDLLNLVKCGVRAWNEGRPKFEGTKLPLQGASLDGLDLAGADFSGCDLSGASLEDSILTRARFTGATLAATDFSYALAEIPSPNQCLRKADIVPASTTFPPASS